MGFADLKESADRFFRSLDIAVDPLKGVRRRGSSMWGAFIFFYFFSPPNRKFQVALQSPRPGRSSPQ